MNAPVSVTSYHRGPLALLFGSEETSSYYGSTSDSAPEPAPDPETTTDWAVVHQHIGALGGQRARLERDVCRWLLAAERLVVHTRAGCASLGEYADRFGGLRPRDAEERLRVGRALAELPVLDAALGSGELCWSAVREMTRVATRETEAQWVGWAKGRRAWQVEQAVAGRRRGDRPNDRSDPSLVKHRLRFEVRAETMALFRDLQARVRADLGGEVDDDALLYEMARRALGGPGDEGRASYQVAVVRCDECGRTSIDAGGVSHPVDDAVAEMAACDSQEVGRVAGPHVGASAAASPPMGAPMGAVPPSTWRPRATQTIPPAIRRHVMRRDHKRCVVPGCANHVFLDVHHLDPRSEGGSHDPERLAVLCGAHHKLVHAYHLAISGTATGGFIFRHADGTSYGAPVSPPTLDLATRVLGTLENLGFKQKRARDLVDSVLRDGAPKDLAGFLEAALRAS